MFKQLKIYYVLIALPFALLLTGSTIFFSAIKLTITRNPHPQINYTIFVIILVGGVLILLNARRLVGEARTTVNFSKAIRDKLDHLSLQELANRYTGAVACLFQLIASSGGRYISHQEQAAIEHELANTRAGLLRRNALPQYLTGLLVGMGLLGTFIGLLATLNDISTLISSFSEIDMKTADPLLVFRTMIERMKAPMQSMGIAFSASMFGLLGSIILGLMMVGIRRLQGDIFSLLSSEVARHIETALAHEASIMPEAGSSLGSGNEFKVLVRIEERLAEAARMQHRKLTSEIDDFQKQRADMLRALTEQAESSNNFRSELQQLGRQLGSLVTVMEKGHSDVSEHLSEMTVNLTGEAKETRKLLGLQVEEQKALREAFDSQSVEERFAEAARLHQEAVSSEIEAFKQQRTEMLNTFRGQSEASNSFRDELQQLGTQLAAIASSIGQDNGEVCSLLSDLTAHMNVDAQETRKLLTMQVNEQRGMKDLLDSYNLEERLAEAARLHQRTLSSEVENFQSQRADMLRTLTEQTEASNSFRVELQQLGRQLEDVIRTMGKGDGEICEQISELMIHMAADAKESQKLLGQLVSEQHITEDSGVEE
jgi:hypothetical protein